jgi:hypothetical protein
MDMIVGCLLFVGYVCCLLVIFVGCWLWLLDVGMDIFDNKWGY